MLDTKPANSVGSTRRQFIAATAPAAAVATLATGAVAATLSAQDQDDARLIALGEQWETVYNEWACRPESEDEYDKRIEREGALVGAVMVIPAQSYAGLLVKAKMLAEATGCGIYKFDAASLSEWAEAAKSGHTDGVGEAAGSLVADLLRLAQEAGR